MCRFLRRLLPLITCLTLSAPTVCAEIAMTYGGRPFYLIDQMRDSTLKHKLMACKTQTPRRSAFSIGHRGAPLMFPEHTRDSYIAAARMGAGVLECDVTFTKDKELVCRHAQNDLHRTTNILLTDLARKCTRPFVPANTGRKAKADCRSSDLTLAELKTLRAKMDSAAPSATTPDTYQGGLAAFRSTLYANSAQVMSHAESIALFKDLGVMFTPELKTPKVSMPFQGFTRADFAQALIDEYKAAGVSPSKVWPQSFDLNDIFYWIENEPEFGAQAVFLDASYKLATFDPNRPETFPHDFADLTSRGLRYIAPPIWVLITEKDGQILPSAYATAAQSAGLKLITWTLERSGLLETGGGWYFQSVNPLIDTDGMYFEVLDVLAQHVGVVAVFSDWPATTTYYANCMGL